MLPSSSSSSPSTAYDSIIDPTLQHPSQCSWNFPVDTQYHWSIPGSTVSTAISQYVSIHGHWNTHSCIHLPGSLVQTFKIISQASEWDLTISGNAAYMCMELALACVTNEKIQLEALKHSLKEKVVRLQSRLHTIEYVTSFYFSKSLTLRLPLSTGKSMTNWLLPMLALSLRLFNRAWSHLLLTKDPPSPLNHNNFNDVRFWTKSSWNSYKRAQRGTTNGNAKKVKKSGQQEKETLNDNCNSLEPNTMHAHLPWNWGRHPCPKGTGDIARPKDAQSLGNSWQAWPHADGLERCRQPCCKVCRFHILNDPRFHYLRLCSNNWKLKYWTSKNYPLGDWVTHTRT